MAMQVEQIDKEKRELTERLRIVSKRVDHWERALRRAELPLLEEDLQRQHTLDREAHEVATKAAQEAAKLHHKEELQTKKRLLRMMNDYTAARGVFAGRRGEEYARRKEEAGRKIEEEKAKRRKTILKQREEERKLREEEERQQREEEDRIRHEEEGTSLSLVACQLEADQTAERERLEQEQVAAEAAARAEEERKKREIEEKAAAERADRLAQREKDLEIVRRQREREEEAERRAAERAAQKQQERMGGARPSPFGAARPVATQVNGGDSAWRRAAPASPAEPPARASYRPPAVRQPDASPSSTVPSSPALGGGGGGWRARAAAKEGPGAPASNGRAGSGRNTPEPASATSPRPRTPQQDDDGFTPVAKPSRGVWRPSRGRG